MMDIKELKVARIRLESDLARLIENRLLEFKDHTGVAIENVSVYMRNIDIVGAERRWIVEGVRVDIVV